MNLSNFQALLEALLAGSEFFASLMINLIKLGTLNQRTEFKQGTIEKGYVTVSLFKSCYLLKLVF